MVENFSNEMQKLNILCKCNCDKNVKCYKGCTNFDSCTFCQIDLCSHGDKCSNLIFEKPFEFVEMCYYGAGKGYGLKATKEIPKYLFSYFVFLINGCF